MRIGLTTAIATAIAIGVVVAGGGGAAACAYPNYPNASCTGVPAGTTLTPSAGDLTVSVDGTTVDSLNITGVVYINANNVTIKNSKMYGVIMSGTVTIQDSEIDCQNQDGARGVQGSYPFGGFGDPAKNFTALRLNIHGCEDAFDASNDFTVQDSYIHDTHFTATSHNDGIQVFDPNINITIRHNYFSWADTSDVQFCSNLGCTPPSNVLVEKNYFFLASGGAYELYCPSVATTNFAINDNAFDDTSSISGLSTECTDTETPSGNFRYPSRTPYGLD